MFQFPSSLEADRNRRMLKDWQQVGSHKQLQELHEYREKMRKSAEDATKIKELRRIEGYLSRIQPGVRLSYIANRPDMLAKRRSCSQALG